VLHRELAIKPNTNVEMACVEMRNGRGKKSLVGIVYNPPDSNHMVRCSIKEAIMGGCQKDTVIIMGDFKLCVDWKSPMAKSRLDDKFIDVFGKFLKQHILESPGEPAILDLVLCNQIGLTDN